MKTVNILVVLVAAVFLTVPLAGAQLYGTVPTVRGPIEARGCVPDGLENCDPQSANAAAHGKPMLTAADGKPTRTILFAHFQDLLQRAPLNTQMPSAEHEADLDRGFLMPTVYTEDESLPCCKFENNRFLMFSSPGNVEILADSQWRVHQEPGLAAEVQIVGIDGNFMYGYWYMSVETKPETVPGPDNSGGVMPAVGVFMRMNLGRFPSTNNVIAEGDTGVGFNSQTPDAQKCQNAPSCISLVSQPGQDQVWEFKVPMDLKRKTMPSVWTADADQKGYVVEVVPYQIENGAVRFTQESWRLRTGAEFAPRLVLDVANPMVTTHTRVHTFDNYLFFRWSFTSPWGSYDVDPNSLQLTVTGPVTLGPGQIEFIKLKHSVDHDGHFKPLNATWRYDYVNKPLPEGTYKVSAMVHNLQNTFMLEWEEEFKVNAKGIPEVEDIGGGPGGSSGGRAAGGSGGDSPGFEAVGLLAALGAAVAVVARRRRA